MQEINDAFQNNKSCFMKIENVADFRRNHDAYHSELKFLPHICTGMTFFSLVQLPVDSFPNWNGNTEISVPFARPSYSSPVLNHFFFSVFVLK